MDGLRDDEGALALHSRELLTKSRLRRKRARVRGPEADRMDQRLEARNPFPAGEALVRRRGSTDKSSGVVFARDESDSESESEGKKTAKPKPKTTTLVGNGVGTVRLTAHPTSSVAAPVKSEKPKRITPIPVFASARPSSTAQSTASDRVAAVGSSPSPSASATTRAPTAAPSTPAAASSSAVPPVSSAVAPVAAPVAPPSAPSAAPDVKAPQPLQPTQTSQIPGAQETGFRFGVAAAKEQDGSEKDLRAGRFSQGAEAGIVIGTLAFIALLGMVIFCYRRKRSRSRGVGSPFSEKGLGFPPRRQTHIMDEAMSAAYDADDRAYAKATPPMAAQSRMPGRGLESPNQRPVYMAQPGPQNANMYPPERAPADQYRARSMPVTDEPEETWRTWSPDQSQATRPLHWL